MHQKLESRARRANRAKPQSKSDDQIVRKLPPFGKSLMARQRFGNLPFLAVVCVGDKCWDSAKNWNTKSDFAALVLPDGESPRAYHWPVNGCLAVVDWNTGPSNQQVTELVECLLNDGAVSVTTWPKFVDSTLPGFEFQPERPAGDRWVQTREMGRTYWPGGGYAA